MPNEIYHRSEWGNPKPEGWGNIYFDADATNELYKRSDNYENSNGTDEILRDIPNKASIVLTPTAYDNGSINSVIPSTNTNLNVSFNNQNGWSWNGSVLSASPASGESRFIDDRFLRQKTYLITFKVLSYTSGSLGYKFGGGSNFNDYFNNDLIEGNIISFQANSDANFPNFQFLTSDFNGSLSEISFTELDTADFDFTRASIATRVNEQGVIEEVASGIPRIDYTSGFGSWLLEPQSTNLFERSEEFDNSYWTKNNLSVTPNQLVSPNGSTNADKVILDSGTNNINGGLFREISTTASTQYAFSIFAKKGEYRYGTIGFGSTSSNGFHFDLEQGIILSEFNASAQYTNVSKEMIDYGNGWYKLIVVTTDDIGSSRFIGIRPHNTVPTATNNNYPSTGDGTSGIYVWGAQLEQKSFATSYTKTEGSTVTRSADVANNSGNADLFNDSEGVLYAEIAALVNDLTVRCISISDGSLDNSIRIAYQTISNSINFRIRSNGVSSHSTNRDVSDITEFAKVAYKYKSGGSSAFINGFKRSTLVSSFAFTNALNQLRFENGSGSQDFYGNTKELAVFKEALTDAELETLTSWVSFTQMATDLEYTLE